MNQHKSFLFLDFARGYAMLGIVLYHVLQRMSLSPIEQKAIAFGGSGVHLFFLISGIGLAFSQQQKKALPILDFYRRRLIKIWWPYVVVLSFSFLAAWQWNVFPDRLDAWLAGVFQYQMFSQDYIESFGGHFWFISTILQFYLLWPAILYLRQGLQHWHWFIVACLFLSVAWWCIVFYLEKEHARNWSSFFLQYLWEFGLGMALADTRFREKIHINPRYYLPIGLIFSGLLIFLQTRLGDAARIFNDIPALLGYGGICLFVFTFSQQFLPALYRMFVWIGGFSFSLYLLHILLLELYFLIFGLQNSAWFILLTYLPMALIISWVFEQLITHKKTRQGLN